MNLMSMLRALLPMLHKDPITALHQADAILAFVALSPGILATMIPTSNSPIVMEAKANPADVIAFLQAELALLEKYPGITKALVTLVPNG